MEWTLTACHAGVAPALHVADSRAMNLVVDRVGRMTAETLGSVLDRPQHIRGKVPPRYMKESTRGTGG